MRHFAILFALLLPLALFSQWQNTHGPLAGGALSFAGSPDYLFAANIAGVFRSDNGGETWENASHGLSPDNSYYDVQASGANVLVSGRHTSQYGADNLVAYLSSDHGDTWAELALPFLDADFFYGIALTDEKLYAANGAGVWERPLQHGNWAPNALGADPFFNIVVQDGRLFALGFKQIAVCSDLSGQTWKKIPVPGLSHVVTNLVARDDTIFVEDYDYRCFRSLDGGTTWKRMFVNEEDLGNVTYAADAYYGLAHFQFLYRSTDAGNTWNAVPGGNSTPRLSALLAAKDQLFGRHYLGGYYRITNDGATFTRLANGMAGGELSAFAHDERQMLVACGHNGLHRFDKTTQAWADSSIFPDLKNVYAVATDGTDIYAGLQYENATACLYRSDDAGQTWQNISPEFGLPPGWSTTIARIIATDSAVFVYEDLPDNRLWRSRNKGASWTQVLGSANLQALGNTLYSLRTPSALFRSDDHGDTWQPLGTAGLPPTAKVAEFFLAADRVFVKVNIPGTFGKFYVGDKDGHNWKPVSTMFNGSHSAPYTMTGWGDVVLACGYRPSLSPDGGKTWTPFSGNLPAFYTNALGADADFVYVAVQNRGIWRLPLADLNFRTVTGTAFQDLNANKLRDPGEPPVPGVVVSAQPAGTHAATDELGRYSLLLNLPDGTEQQLGVHPPAPHLGVSSAPIVVTNATLAADIPVRLLPFGTDLGVYAALLSPIRIGQDVQIMLLVRNEGGTPAQGRVYFKPDANAENYQTVPAADGSIADALFWDVPMLAPGKSYMVRLTALIPSATTYGTTFAFRAYLNPPPAADHNLVNDSARVEARTFPKNQPVWKTAQREQIFWDEIQSGERLTFLIAFKNPHPDTVRHARVEDYLETDLDLTSIQILASSHPVRMGIQGDGLIQFFFDGIVLPDSVSDPGALGFVAFSVGCRPGTPPNTYVHNSARVYFEGHESLSGSNTVQVHIAPRATTNLAPPPPYAEPVSVHIVPNPNTGTFRVHAPDFSAENTMLRLFDQIGRLCLQQAFGSGEVQASLPFGTYVLHLGDGRKVASVRLVVIR